MRRNFFFFFSIIQRKLWKTLLYNTEGKLCEINLNMPGIEPGVSHMRDEYLSGEPTTCGPLVQRDERGLCFSTVLHIYDDHMKQR